MKKIMVLLILFLSVQSVYARRVMLSDTEYCESMTQKIFKLKHSNVEEISKIVVPMLTKKGSVLVDPGTNTVVVKDIGKNINAIEEKIEALEFFLGEEGEGYHKTEKRDYFKAIAYAKMSQKQQKEFSGFLGQLLSSTNEACMNKYVLYLKGTPEQLEKIDLKLKTLDLSLKETDERWRCPYAQVIFHNNTMLVSDRIHGISCD